MSKQDFEAQRQEVLDAGTQAFTDEEMNTHYVAGVLMAIYNQENTDVGRRAIAYAVHVLIGEQEKYQPSELPGTEAGTESNI